MIAKNTRRISCPSCAKENSFKNNDLLDMPASLACVHCGEALLVHFDEPLKDLPADAFIHPLDRQMLTALRRIPGIDSVLKTLLRHSFELSMRLHHQGNFLQVSKKQLKSLNKLAERAASHLDIGFMPEIYVVPEARANAYTFGVEKCAVAISSGCLELMSDEEILAVLAHEFGHIKANHVLYKTASRILSSLAEGIAQKTLGIGGLMLYPLQLALLRWDRASELSSDRAALLVVKNPQVMLTTLMKLAGGSARVKELNINAFIEQAENYEKTQDDGPLGKYIAVMNSMFSTHPFPIWRAREVIDWVKSGEFIDILQGGYLKNARLGSSCTKCGTEVVGTGPLCDTCRNDKSQDSNDKDQLDKTIKNFQSWLKKNLNA